MQTSHVIDVLVWPRDLANPRLVRTKHMMRDVQEQLILDNVYFRIVLTTACNIWILNFPPCNDAKRNVAFANNGFR